jgi:hypothetical protein
MYLPSVKLLSRLYEVFVGKSIISFHERNLHKYVGESERILSVKKRLALADQAMAL